MSLDTHLKIIEALANGINPVTGEELTNESPYSHPDVIKGSAAVNRMKLPSSKRPKVKKTIEQKQSENVGNGFPENAGLPWTKEQRDELASQFEADERVPNLAKTHGRTKNAITSELKKQGLIER
ncbi:hypothetical protein HWQ46_10615 [Shewanella sp. D64]|uniref:hypothetical protein n=1 Tax=unclassified Shewanella TaxID=196818 RepID=UPI0022BA3EEF|nr:MULTISPECIES: hypothetical protein [unclassified Shewanella]MEC4725999.1 hypothetical protein [Shewanella sp. D64]MEC4737254.1 hypothetical protein [Shewanella sp. E94]WBJ93631.1 hypothetical protein HWQ47_17065 [Shewanella sp. MTB7]